MANRLSEYLAEIRAIDGLKNASLCGITVSKKDSTAEFFLVTDKTYTVRDEAAARAISEEYLPENFSARVKIVKRVPDAEGLQKRIYEYIQKTFPAAAAFLEMENIEVEMLSSGANFYIDIASGEQTLFTSGNILDAGEKAAAKAEIEGYLADTVYLEEQATVRTEAVTAGLAAVVAAKNSEEIALAVTTVKSAVDALETKASIVDAAKAELNAYKAEEGLYREAQATERAGYIATAETAMDNAATQAEVNEAVATAKAAIDTLKTDAELTAEEQDAANKVLAQEKEVGLDKINEIKAGVNYTKYSTENQTKINDLYKTAKDLIADALTSEEISAAVSAFETEISKVPQVEEKEEDNNDVTPDDDATSDAGSTDIMAQLGCTSVVGVSGVMALTIALGAFVCAKKRKEN